MPVASTSNSPKIFITFGPEVVFFGNMAQRIEMLICLGSSCFSRGNRDVVAFIREYLRKNHLEDRIIFKGARCMNLCSNGPNLKINERIIEGVTISKIESILEKEFGDIK